MNDRTPVPGCLSCGPATRCNRHLVNHIGPEQAPPSAAEGKLIDLMQALEDSVREAKASRARKLAADAGGEG